ncbi:MAG: iron ABC transporter substrate-binding protein [Calothrix sp. MO_167.B12]|nr:iron ABC transporter substrate-binding protein [Calothrix sp. MO_167.B12]
MQFLIKKLYHLDVSGKWKEGMKRRKFVYLVGLATTTGILAIACGANPDSSNTAQTNSTDTTTVSNTTSSSGQELVIYSGRKEKLVGELIKQFETESGIKVKVRYGGTSELASAILEEGNNSPADIFFAQDAGALGAIQKAGKAIQLKPEILNQVENKYRSPQGKWVGITGRVRSVDYNTNLVKPEDLPDSIFGFTDPKWKGKIGWAPTNGSFQSFVTALRVSEGDAKTKEWLKGIKANDVKVYPKNTPIVKALGRGEIAVGFVNHYYSEKLKKDDPKMPVAHHFTKDVGSLVNVAGIAILGSSKKLDMANKFTEFMLSEKAQNYFASKTFEYPLIKGVNPQGNLKSLKTIKKQDKNIDLSNLDDLNGTLKLMQEANIL